MSGVWRRMVLLREKYFKTWWANFFSYDSKSRKWKFWVQRGPSYGKKDVEHFIVTGTTEEKWDIPIFYNVPSSGSFLFLGYENYFKIWEPNNKVVYFTLLDIEYFKGEIELVKK